MEVKSIVLNEKRNVTLTACLQGVGGDYEYVTKRPGVIILPGGGYQYCTDREAEPVAMPYLKAGYQAFILRYSVGKDAVWPNPLDDYDQAMEYLQAHAEEWNLYADKIAVIGFSAGGHLAACAATMAKHRPAAAILGYSILNEDAQVCVPHAPDAVKAVDYQTCPCFLFASRNDQMVPIANSIQFMNALAENGISFESHIYAYGPHGFSTGDSSIQNPDTTVACSRMKDWVEDSIEWLKDMFGDFCTKGMTKPACPSHFILNGEATLSVECTIEYLMQNPQSKAILEQIVKQFSANMPDLRMMPAAGLPKDQLPSLILHTRLCDALAFLQTPEEMIQQLDATLKQIPNT